MMMVRLSSGANYEDLETNIMGITVFLRNLAFNFATRSGIGELLYYCLRAISKVYCVDFVP